VLGDFPSSRIWGGGGIIVFREWGVEEKQRKLCN
jgi:hypothetical protein